MAIDQATLDQYITEVAGDDQELANTLRDRLKTNEKAANNFVGGFLRNADYTKKTQAIAQQKQQFEQLQSDYESRLTQADSEKDKIMRDLATERISASKAQALLKTVKEAYGLSEDDLPGIEDIRETARTGRVVDTTPDLDQRLGEFKKSIMSEITNSLIPEISGLAILGPIWNEIGYEHEKLFGKRLTKKEQGEILEQARKDSRSLESVWQEKYNVADKRLEFRDNENKTKWRREWEDEQAKLNQEIALKGVRPEANEFALQDRQSPIFKRDFTPKVDHDANGDGQQQQQQTSTRALATDAQRERMSGADRAAAKWIERSRSGQLGKPIEQRKTA